MSHCAHRVLVLPTVLTLLFACTPAQVRNARSSPILVQLHVARRWW